MSRNIAIRPHPDKLRHRGDKAVIVDGEQWGVVQMQRRGRNGAVYTFLHVSGAPVFGEDGLYARVRSDGYMHRCDETPTEPLPKRLLAHAVNLIETGRLKAPAILRAERDEIVQREKIAREDREVEKRAVFQRKAEDCLVSADPVAAIVEALLWAQSQ